MRELEQSLGQVIQHAMDIHVDMTLIGAPAHKWDMHAASIQPLIMPVLSEWRSEQNWM